jgi:hypothetical protein
MVPDREPFIKEAGKSWPKNGPESTKKAREFQPRHVERGQDLTDNPVG